MGKYFNKYIKFNNGDKNTYNEKHYWEVYKVVKKCLGNRKVAKNVFLDMISYCLNKKLNITQIERLVNGSRKKTLQLGESDIIFL